MDVELDLRRTPTKAAAEYYELSKKQKKKIKGVEEALKKTVEELAKLKKEKAVIEDIKEKTKKSKEKSRWYHKFRWFTSSDGLLVVGGKDATSNEILIKKHTNPADLVFHAHLQGAPFFVVKNENRKEIPEQTLREAAEAAASYSSGWKQGIGSVNVYYVSPDQLSKTPEPGEYLTKGAFVVRGEREWFRNTELKLAVGFMSSGYSIVGGPESSVKEKTKYYAAIKPGGRKPNKLAQEIKGELLRKTNKEDGRILKQTPIEEILKCIPAGGGRLS